MTTVREYITDALIELCVMDPTMSLEASMGAHALRVLNRMLEAWSTEDLLIYTENRDVYALTPGKQDYTLGIGGDINVERPVHITRCSALLTQNTPNTEIPIPILTTQEWQGMTVKQVNGSFPTAVWITGDFPLQKLWFWPVPSITCGMVLYSWGQLYAFDKITDDVSFPKGYADAIVYNLAVRLAPTYGREVSGVLASLAANAKSRIRTLNEEPIYISSVIKASMNIGLKSFGIVVD